MGYSQLEKNQTHDRILQIAGQRFRESGLDGLSIADLMKDAGLTHGGFYKHFNSKNDLVTQVLERAFKEGRLPEVDGKKKGSQQAMFRSVVKQYLSKTHRDMPGAACALSALVSDVGRADDSVKKLYETEVEQRFSSLAALIGDPDVQVDREKAILAFCAMAGAIGVARAVADDNLSNEILKTVRSFLNDQLVGKPDAAI